MKKKRGKTFQNNGNGNHTPTLGELIAAVRDLTDDDQMCAHIVADMINRQQVQLGGSFENTRVIVS